jgi:hypothetical protein
VTTLNITINGHAHGPTDVRDDLTMNDFLREYLGMTGTKFGCGAAQCLSCAVIIDNPDGSSYTSPTCIVPALHRRFPQRRAGPAGTAGEDAGGARRSREDRCRSAR